MDFGRAYDPLRALGVAARLLARAPLTLVVGGALVVLTDVDSRQGKLSMEALE